MKKTMTKLMALIMALTLVLAFAACGRDTPEDASTEPSTDAISETETDTQPAEPESGTAANTDPSETTTKPGEPIQGPSIVKPNNTAEAVKLYNDALAKTGTMTAKCSRVMEKAKAGPFNLMEIDARIPEKFKLDNSALAADKSKLQKLDAGSIASSTYSETDTTVTATFVLKDANGGDSFALGTNGFMYFINMDEAVTLVNDIGHVLNESFEINVNRSKTTIYLTGGKFVVTVDKATGNISSASLTFTERLDSTVKTSLLGPIPVPADITGSGTVTYSK